MDKNSEDIIKINKVEEKLVDFWNEYIDVIKYLSGKYTYVAFRNVLFQDEVASRVHDIQGRIAILEKEVK